jgi:hypothetical protein
VHEEGGEEQEDRDAKRGEIRPDARRDADAARRDADAARHDPDPAHQHGRARQRNPLALGVPAGLWVGREVPHQPARHEEDPEQDPSDQEQGFHSDSSFHMTPEPRNLS